MMKYVGFYFLALGRAAEGEIAINWPNVVFFAIALAIGFIVGKIV